MTVRTHVFLSSLVVQGTTTVKGALPVYATHVQRQALGQKPAHLGLLLRDVLLTIHRLRQPRQDDQGVHAAAIRWGAALQHAPRAMGLIHFASLLVSLVGCAGSANRVHPPVTTAPSPAGTASGPTVATPGPIDTTPGPIGTAPGPSETSGASVATTVPLEPCPSEMVTLPTFCIDRYEAPNVLGQLPLTLQTAGDGEAWCAERHKRLCTETEWIRACEGPHGRRYPYGNEHRESACNDDRRWIPVRWDLLARWPNEAAIDEAKRLFQADPSGARAGCVSEEGIHDLTGNAAEWVRRSDAPPRPGYDHVLKGCYWAGCYHEPHPNCTFRNSAHPGSFRTYEAGFRCCSDRAS